jgi:SAM-dependent methyltransferase
MKCISCNFNVLSAFIVIPNAPMRAQVISKNLLAKDRKINLKIFKCERCGLVQLSKENYVADNYYNDYMMSRTYSSFSRHYQKSLSKDFVSFFDLKNKLIIDVGFGDGYFSLALMKQGAKVLGIEPSEVASKLAVRKGVRVVKAYVDDSFKLLKKADAFVACQVFEHTSNPKNLLANIKKFLKLGGYGMIEVPSLVKSLSDDRFYDFFPDHVAYYSPSSLCYMLQLNGFDVISIKHTANSEYITAYFKYTRVLGLESNAQILFASYKKELKEFFKRLKGKKIALWGAGAKGISAASFSNISNKDIVFCIDSDPNKFNHYLPGSHIRVVSPAILDKEKVDIVIVTAMMYRDEIVSTLMNKYKYDKSKIVVIAPRPMFIKR